MTGRRASRDEKDGQHQNANPDASCEHDHLRPGISQMNAASTLSSSDISFRTFAEEISYVSIG